MQIIKDLREVELDVDLIGGKAYNLAKLIRGGFNVPRAYCITTDYYREKTSGAVSGSRDGGAKVTEEEIEIDEELRQEIGALIQEFGSLSVRSSATIEDSEGSSFAGQFKTFLNQKTVEDVVESIKGCWLSLWSEETERYLEERGGDNPAMAVILQEQIDSEFSGVIFTLNPLSGRENEMLIESIAGLGEGVVEGHLTPDRHVCDWLDRRVISFSRGGYDKIFRLSPGGGSELVKQDKPEELTPEQLEDLMELGEEVGQYYGYPQDIEWAIAGENIFLLQSRPITSINFDPELGQWTNANFVEVFPGFHNPLSFSLTGGAFSKTIKEFFKNIKILRDEPSEEPWHALIFGRTYWKVSEVKALVSKIPGYNERSFDTTTGISVDYEGDGVTTPWTLGRIIWALPVLFSLSKEYDRYWREAERYTKEFFTKESSWLERTKALSSMNDGELESYTEELFRLDLETNFVAQYTSFLATQSQDDFHTFLDGINERLRESERISPSKLFTGLRDVKTAAPLLEMNRLAKEIRESGKATLLHEMEGKKISVGDLPEDLSAVAEFVEKYYWMAETDEDLACPRWIDDPSTPILLIAKLTEREDLDTDQEERQSKIQKEEEERAMRILNRGLGRFLFLRKKSFRDQVKIVRRYSWWREETREMLSRVYYFLHRALGELSERYESQGLLESASDIFYLTYQQVIQLFEELRRRREGGHVSRTDIEELRGLLYTHISRYKRTKEMFENFIPPGTIGGRQRFDEERESDLHGVGCSQGEAIGYTRVLNSLDDIKDLREGEIAVVPYTNPGWTPIFSLISGIIMEEGGLLSHGSVVAREYGVPAVIQIRDARRILGNGRHVKIDGNTGAVTILG